MQLAVLINYVVVFLSGYALGVITTPLLAMIGRMANENIQKPEDLQKLKLILGVIILVLLIIIHAFVRELPVWYLAFPAFLMGLDFEKFTKK